MISADSQVRPCRGVSEFAFFASFTIELSHSSATYTVFVAWLTSEFFVFKIQGLIASIAKIICRAMTFFAFDSTLTASTSSGWAVMSFFYFAITCTAIAVYEVSIVALLIGLDNTVTTNIY